MKIIYLGLFAVIALFCLSALTAEPSAYQNIPIESYNGLRLPQQTSLFKAEFLPTHPVFKQSHLAPLSYSRLWLKKDTAIHAVWKVLARGVGPLSLWWVYLDANSNHILRMTPFMQYYDMPANAFHYVPDAEAENATNIEAVTLTNLNSNAAGSPLAGSLVETHDCCIYTKCYDGSSSCDPSELVCADQSDSTAQISQKVFHIPAKIMQSAYSFPISNDVYVDAVHCNRIQSARAHIVDGQLGFFETPIDGTSNDALLDDNFSEIQAYYSANDFLSYMTSLTTLPTSAFPLTIYTNQVLPDFPVDSDSMQQALASGQGTAANPIEEDSIVRISNAAFVQAMPSTFQAQSVDEITGELVNPFNAVYLFHGDRDFSLDGEVVMHETTHFVNHLLTPSATYMALDTQGANVEPGAMAEGWADYFAASFSARQGVTNASVIGSYADGGTSSGTGEGGRRDLSKPASCPGDLTGEVHLDSGPFSHALWSARNAIYAQLNNSGVTAWDQVVLTGMAQAKDDETFATQTQRILTAMAASPEFTPALISAVSTIFSNANILNCARVVPLTDTQPYMFLEAPLMFGVTNFVPPPFQLAIAVPAGTQSVSLAWSQSFDANGFIQSSASFPTAANSTPLRILVQADTPVSWGYTQTQSVPMNNGQALTVSPDANASDQGGGNWSYAFNLPQSPSAPQKIYVSFLSTDNGYVLQNIKLNLSTDKVSSTQGESLFAQPADGSSADESAPGTPGCSCSQGQSAGDAFVLLGLVTVLAVGLSRRRVR